MNLSYFTLPLHLPGRDYSATLHADRAAILAADALGFAAAFVGEHVTDRAATISSCFNFLAARAYGMDAGGPYGHYYRSLMRKLIGNGRPDLFRTHAEMADGDVTHEFVMNSLVICGTPAQVTQRIRELRDEVGEFGMLVYAGHDWADVALSRRSMELMAREVMPAVDRTLGETPT